MNRRRSVPGRPPPGAYFPPARVPEAAPVESAPAAPVVSVSDSVESFTAEASIPKDIEVSVYQTARPWRAIDVYIEHALAAPSALHTFTVRIYARMPGGLRVLVASGRKKRYGTAGLDVISPFPYWIASARAQATTFEITVSSPSVTAGQTQLVKVSAVASNEANEPPPWVGLIRSNGFAGTALKTSGGLIDPELVHVTCAALETVVDPRFLHIYDDANAPGVNAPTYVLPVTGPGGVSSGPGLFRFNQRAGSGVWQAVASSTAATTTVVADVMFQMVLR